MLIARKLFVDRTPRAAFQRLEKELRARQLIVLAPLSSDSPQDTATCSGVLMAVEQLQSTLLGMGPPQRVEFLGSLNELVAAAGSSALVVPPSLQELVAQMKPDEPYYVKGSAAEASSELRRRSQRLLGMQCGRSMAEAGIEAMEKEIEVLLDKLTASIGAGEEADAYHVAVFHGMIIQLSTTDPALAQTMALNERLPPLNANVATALARLPVVSGADFSAFDAMASTYSSRDAQVPSWSTVATALAVRARKVHWDVSLPPDVRRAAYVCQKALSASHRVDPSMVFASNVMSIQEWSLSQSGAAGAEGALAADRMLQRLIHLQASLRSTTANAVGHIAMSDVERPWVSHIVASDRAARGGEWATALPTILQDPKRWLVDSRLLTVFAELLADGHIGCRDPSFPSFVDECGECYLNEQPKALRFTFLDVQRGPDGPMELPTKDAHKALFALAPTSSYWTTLLQKMFDTNVKITKTADGLAWHAEVTLPEAHEATRFTDGVAVPDVIYEDEDLVAFQKPAGLPVSRHALCCSQRGGTPFTDLSSVLLKSTWAMFKPGSGVFRGGQLHRLDLDTTGVILYAKTEQAMRSLRHQIGTSAEHGAYPKCYTALCRVLESDLSAIKMAGVINDSHDSRIKTRYSIIKFFKGARVALVECRIQQGKKHQIRRHLASIGMPILQDVEYGGAACTTPLINRIALHASGISFVHPTRRRPFHVAASLPADMSDALAVLHNTLRK